MAPLPLFYSSIAVLDRNTHRQSRLAPPKAPYAFAAGAHVLPALMAEFAPACRDMPILFLEEQGAVSPLFMVGMRPGEGCFVDAEGRWRGQHAPAYLRRYPFIGGDLAGEQQVICLDGGYAGLQEAEGERLFDDILEQRSGVIYASMPSYEAGWKRLRKPGHRIHLSIPELFADLVRRAPAGGAARTDDAFDLGHDAAPRRGCCRG